MDITASVPKFAYEWMYVCVVVYVFMSECVRVCLRVCLQIQLYTYFTKFYMFLHRSAETSASHVH